METPLLVKNGIIVTPHRTIKNGSILVSGGKIREVGSVGKVKKPTKANIINAKGNIVAPGFIDVHSQGAGGADILDGSKNALKTIARTLAKNGTTSFLATTVLKNGKTSYLGLIDEVIKEGTGGANLLGVHLEGPYINPARRGMIRKENIKKASLKSLEDILKRCRGRLAMMTVAPEVKGVLDIIPVLKKKGIVVSFGHSNATYEETRKGLKRGITHVTHIFNAMPPLHHRMPGPLSAIFEDKNCSTQLISDGIHIHPSVVKLLVRIIGVDRIVLITDSMSSTALPDGRYVYNNIEYTSEEGIAKYHDGTLIGSSLTLRQMVKRFINITGVTLGEAIKAASFNPAKVLGIEDKKGSIEEGKDADLIIMDRDFGIKRSIIGGKIMC